MRPVLPIEPGGGSLSRRRSKNPTYAISITLPRTMLEELDNRLNPKESRSRYIRRALAVYMDQGDGVWIPTRQLMAMLHARIDDETLKTILIDRLTSSSSTNDEQDA